MNKELIIRSSSDFVDFALLKDGKLIELHKEEEKSNFQVIFLSPKYENQLLDLMLLCKCWLRKDAFYIITI
jgi:16S rRNA G966 N2-methylase RsmD